MNADNIDDESLSSRAFGYKTTAYSWEEIWEAGPYYDRVSGLFDDAEDYVILAGWQIDSRLPLKKSRTSTENETLREKLVRLCEEKPSLQIYFLIWDHAYFYVLEREIWQGRIWENLHPRVHFVFDNRHPFGVSHHEKIIIFDGDIALSGGIDLCDERWDSPEHHYRDARRSRDWKSEKYGPYHDLAVQVTGPICHFLQDHIASRWCALSTIPFPESRKEFPTLRLVEGHTVYLSRTQSEIERAPREKGITREVEFLFRDLIQSAKKRIILEGQYYWSKVVNDMLMSKIHAMRGKDFELVLILSELQWIRSWTRYMMPYELTLMQQLISAAQFSKVKLMLGSPYVYDDSSSGKVALPPRPIYIHSKLIVIDDQFLSIGTANFATRALRLDTEIHLTLEAHSETERNHIQNVVQTVFKHWNIRPWDHYFKGNVSAVSLRRYIPRVELEHLRKSLSFWSFMSWQILFDPSIAWFFPLKAQFQKWFKKKKGLRLFARFMVFGISRSFFSIPVVLVLSLAILYFGPKLSAMIYFSIFGAFGFFTYGLIRAFPISAGWFYLPTLSPNLIQKMGVRKFVPFLTGLLDPRISLRTKVALQGLYCTPLPWFILGTVIVLPSAVYFAAYGCARLILYLWKNIN